MAACQSTPQSQSQPQSQPQCAVGAVSRHKAHRGASPLALSLSVDVMRPCAVGAVPISRPCRSLSMLTGPLLGNPGARRCQVCARDWSVCVDFHGYPRHPLSCRNVGKRRSLVVQATEAVFVVHETGHAFVLQETGAAVVNGAMSTLVAALCLAGSGSYVFITFFYALLLIVLFGAFQGLVVLPVLLLIFRPAAHVAVVSGGIVPARSPAKAAATDADL